MVGQSCAMALVMVAVAGGTAAAQSKPDYAALAEHVVGTSAHVREGDVVEIETGPADAAFAEEIAIAVRKRGGWPLITMWSENLSRRMTTDVPAKYDTQAPTADLALAKLIDVRITIPAVRDFSIFQSLPPDRLIARSKAYGPVVAERTRRKVRMVELDNQLAPSAARAKLYGISEAELAQVYWSGLGADFGAIQAKAKQLADTLSAGSELHVTAPNGTDFKVKIRGRRISTSDGTIDDAKMKLGGPLNAWLPAGEVYLVPVPGTAEGHIVDDHNLVFGTDMQGVTVDIKAGKITSISAKSGWEAVEKLWDGGGPGKTEISSIDFGCNPAVKSSGRFESYIAAGMITIGSGNNVELGGTNTAQPNFAFMLPNTTVTLDGKPLIENGSLK